MKQIEIKHYDKKLKRDVVNYYTPVVERVKAFRTDQAYQGWSLETEILSDDGKSVTMRAVVRDQFGVIRGDGIAHEKEGDGFINDGSHYENCQTSAWGRAMASINIGLTDDVASADEVENAQLNQAPIIADQKKEIYDLLRNATGATGAQKARIKKEMHEYNDSQAANCISWLESKQGVNPVDAGANTGQTEIKEQLKKVVGDVKVPEKAREKLQQRIKDKEKTEKK